MLKLVESRGPYLEFRASGWLSRDDYTGLANELVRAVQGQPELYILADVAGFKGWRPGGLVEEVKLARVLRARSMKIALIGDHKVQRLASQLLKPLLHVPMRYFEAHQRREALAWLGYVDLVDEAGMESFPASDPPPFTLGR